MKLKNLLFATMIACAFASCSNDDDPINDGGNGGDTKADATLSLVTDRGNATTKAVGDGETGDGTINTLAIAIFNGATNGAYDEEYKAGDLVMVVYKDNPSALTVEDIAVRVGNIDVVVLANVPKTKLADKATLADFKALINTFNTDVITGQDNSLNTNGLVISSDVQTLTIQPGKNYVGYASAIGNHANGKELTGKTIKLYRTVSRIQLGKINLSLDDEVKADYVDFKFTAKNAFIMNAKTTSSLFASTNVANWTWGNAVEITTGPAYFCGLDAVKDAMGKYKNAINTVLPYYDYNLTNISGKKHIFAYKEGGNSNDENVTTEETYNKAFYVYENTDLENPTLLVLYGSIDYKTSTGVAKHIDNTYFSVPVNAVGLAAENYTSVPKHEGIKRNVDYVVNLTIKGAGADSPVIDGTGRLNVKMELVPYGTVTHNADRE